MSDAIEAVVKERSRQISQEGWSSQHDDRYMEGELVSAAVSYARPDLAIDLWPWDDDWYKCSTERRNLVKAAALLIAEIERLDRLGEDE